MVLIGFLRNLQKCDLNLPDISCSGSPLLCLCVKNFLFCNCFHVFVSFWTETYFFIGIFFLLWFAKIDALSITHVESRFNRLCLVSSCHGSMVPRWWIMSNFSGTKRIWTFPKHNLNSELSIFAYLSWLWPRNVEKNDLMCISTLKYHLFFGEYERYSSNYFFKWSPLEPNMSILHWLNFIFYLGRAGLIIFILNITF